MTPPRKKNPTSGVAVLIVAVVLFVLATLLYNAITEKRDYDRQNDTASATSARAASLPAAHACS
ncbi:hypothetical protein [Paraburkholderia hayleyella]|uniref:hypothetical protein n=1 Tax=Paraburkholderia hayleyella TaxID=2152889 RepID=UPI0012915962|nr:hypothetical protein [Paraburkholderia hayleyella]